MIPISEALKIIKRETFALSAETIDLENSVNRVLAETVKADMDLPPFDRSQMDGFAVRFEDAKNAPAKLKIVGESVAGLGFDKKLNAGEAVRIMTGARVPEGADAVQKVELTAEADGFVEISEAVKRGQNIVLRGQETKKAAKIFKKGEIITAQKIAALASFGYARVKVFRKPRVTILATGSEIVDVAETPQKDQIRNSNSVMLKTFAENFADLRVLPLINDDLEDLKNQIAIVVGQTKTKAADENFRLQIANCKFELSNSRYKTQYKNESAADAMKDEGKEDEILPNEKRAELWDFEIDILIITGGVSVGDYDFTKPALRELGAEIFFERVNLKPGKPTVFGKLNDTLVFGLPGNPVSVAVTFYLFARTAILLMQSARICELEKGFAVAAEKIKAAKERDSFLPVFVAPNSKGKLVIESLRFSGSSNFIEFARANALVCVPQNKNLEKGDIAEIRFLD